MPRSEHSRDEAVDAAKWLFQRHVTVRNRRPGATPLPGGTDCYLPPPLATRNVIDRRGRRRRGNTEWMDEVQRGSNSSQRPHAPPSAASLARKALGPGGETGQTRRRVWWQGAVEVCIPVITVSRGEAHLLFVLLACEHRFTLVPVVHSWLVRHQRHGGVLSTFRQPVYPRMARLPEGPWPLMHWRSRVFHQSGRGTTETKRMTSTVDKSKIATDHVLRRIRRSSGVSSTSSRVSAALCCAGHAATSRRTASRSRRRCIQISHGVWQDSVR